MTDPRLTPDQLVLLLPKPVARRVKAIMREDKTHKLRLARRVVGDTLLLVAGASYEVCRIRYGERPTWSTLVAREPDGMPINFPAWVVAREPYLGVAVFIRVYEFSTAGAAAEPERNGAAEPKRRQRRSRRF